MKKILVLGGTRFFGKKLVELLIKNGEDVTIATRGKTNDPFQDTVKRLVIDREDYQSLKLVAGSQDWDIVYDNICYSPQAAMDAVSIFSGKVKQYILTSSQSVYGFEERKIIEEDFDPISYPIKTGVRSDFTYDEGKRLAEAVFFQKADFPVSAVRFPIVLGTDDYTNRLLFHINHVSNETPIGIPNENALISFISSEEAAAFLHWLGKAQLRGPINACSTGEMSIQQIISIIEEAVGKKALTELEVSNEHMSPFGIAESWYLDNSKATHAGYNFQHINNWFPSLVQALVNK
ncbi:NAD-dependent epimerase/dehydratase family protein [Bacillus solimangrovi]|uniref:NAD-dependent dehydratase n=1 Tax=Bacillus solimangrovi TaxID=1305675 RepID=A0A1E5LHS3_9BACI|nr:NAD-dependent epimerase/dehydratase family protein [Bacillus solimangrovi]OEH93630.1 NAD-dependent dehydratase [Bacillus solimangrovi]